jgi:hypothetical protein
VLGYAMASASTQWHYSNGYETGYHIGYEDGLNQTSPANIKPIIALSTEFLTLKMDVRLINVGLAPARNVTMRYQVLDQDDGTEGTGETIFLNVKNGTICEKDLSINYDLGDTTLKLIITLEYENQTKTYEKNITLLFFSLTVWSPE